MTRGLTLLGFVPNARASHDLLMSAVVFVAVNLTGLAVLLMVDLLFFLRSQFAAVGSTVVAYLMVDASLVVLEVRGFAGR